MQSQQDEKINRAMRLINYEFNDTNWLWEALQTPGSGVRIAGDRRVIDGNKILALLGDKLLGTFVVETLVSHNLAVRGTIDTQVQRAVNNAQLAETFDSLDFVHCLNLNPSQGKAIGARTKADTIEAIIGAVYMDGGLDAARRVAIKLTIL
ncbi:hypothetical protein CSIM01_04576 [Colletotrichum simmondsii]|uniref:RNase III domain-containing protein n=1 Tax=Colletotrichum simmondsii TaxID=703756 RepID=A0A135SQC7_9PEZI|nr:hypothetical protein CSIM01_04576 [Colletotrichum simmondsii]